MATEVTKIAGPSETNSLEPLEGNYFVSAYPPFSCWKSEAVEQIQQRLGTAGTAPSDVPLGLYVHIPFCAQRCDYCYYRSYAGCGNDEKDRYVNAVLEEAVQYRDQPALRDRRVSFVYFGGGTPSLLINNQIRKLLSNLQTIFAWRKIQEITFECAPKTVTLDKLRLLRELGVTRISLGVQQFDDAVLRANGRIHMTADVQRAYDMIRDVGFDTVNLDLMVGLVGETNSTFRDSVERCIELGTDCVTIYQLEIPRNTPLYRALHSEPAQLAPASWDVKRGRLAEGFRRLEQAGYSLRSAYTAVRDPQRHRFVYQDSQYHGADFLGLGVAAFSYFDGAQFQNFPRLDDYLARVEQQELPLSRAYLLNDEEQMVREFVLQLKLGSVSRDYFRGKYHVDILSRFDNSLKRLASQGWLHATESEVRLTRDGLLRADRLVPYFYLPEHQGVPYV